MSNKIEDFLNEQSDQLIKDWEIVTKKDYLNWKKDSIQFHSTLIHLKKIRRIPGLHQQKTG